MPIDHRIVKYVSSLLECRQRLEEHNQSFPMVGIHLSEKEVIQKREERINFLRNINLSLNEVIEAYFKDPKYIPPSMNYDDDTASHHGDDV